MIEARLYRKDEIADTFDYLKLLALDAVENRKVGRMYFTLEFDVGSLTEVTSEITEVVCTDVQD